MAKGVKAADVFNALGKARGSRLVVSELLEGMMQVWGGPAEFCKAYHTEFMAAKAGGIARTRMLDSIIRLFITHTANLKGLGTDMTNLSEDEIKQTLLELLEGRGDAPQ
jgi:hypothetical protein